MITTQTISAKENLDSNFIEECSLDDSVINISLSDESLLSINSSFDSLSYPSRVMPKEISESESSWQEKSNVLLRSERNARKNAVDQYKNDILSIIMNDNFEDGVTSQSENYIRTNATKDNIEYIREAANSLYLKYYDDPNVLTGLLIMMGTLSYDDACEQGPTMALGILQHKNISVRDRAIQAFERWNSKKGIPVLKSLHCDKLWLQRYVNKVIKYLERDGIE